MQTFGLLRQFAKSVGTSCNMYFLYYSQFCVGDKGISSGRREAGGLDDEFKKNVGGRS